MTDIGTEETPKTDAAEADVAPGGDDKEEQTTPPEAVAKANGAAEKDKDADIFVMARSGDDDGKTEKDNDDQEKDAGERLLDGDQWRAKIEKLPDELRDQVGRYTSEFEALRALVEAKKALRSRIKVPDKLSDPEEIAEFRKKIGVPEQPDGYEIEIPDDLDEDVSEATRRMIDRLHKAGATTDVAKATIEALLYEQSEAERRYTEALRAQADEAEQKLRRQWGEDFNRQVALAERFLKRLSPELSKELQEMKMADGRVLGNHPQFVELMNIAARSISEDAISPPARIANNEQITGETLQSFYKKHYEALNNTQHPEHAQRRREYNEISNIVASRQKGGNAIIGPS